MNASGLMEGGDGPGRPEEDGLPLRVVPFPPVNPLPQVLPRGHQPAHEAGPETGGKDPARVQTEDLRGGHAAPPQPLRGLKLPQETRQSGKQVPGHSRQKASVETAADHRIPDPGQGHEPDGRATPLRRENAPLLPCQPGVPPVRILGEGESLAQNPDAAPGGLDLPETFWDDHEG